MANPVTQFIAGLFVFTIPIVVMAIVVLGYKIFKELLSSHSISDSRSSEEENLEYIERHFGDVRID